MWCLGMWFVCVCYTSLIYYHCSLHSAQPVTNQILWPARDSHVARRWLTYIRVGSLHFYIDLFIIQALCVTSLQYFDLHQ